MKNSPKIKEEETIESFDHDISTTSKQLLNLTTKGFIHINDLKFKENDNKPNSQDNPIFSEEYSLDQEILDLSKGKYHLFREKSFFSLLQVSSNLQELDLTYNKLAFFPIELIHCSHLRVIKLDYNEIKALSNDIDRLLNLEFFSISNNQLLNLPNSISKLTKLKVLNIGKNQIKDIQPILTIKTLETLYLYGNPILFFPMNFIQLKNLKELALEWFKYTEPGINPIIKRPLHDKIFEKLYNFCSNKSEKNESKENIPKTVSTINMNRKSINSPIIKISSYITNNESMFNPNSNNNFTVTTKTHIEMLDFLRYFSTEKLDLLQKDSKGRNLLHNAAFEDEIGVLYAMAMKFPRLLNLVDKDGQTPLTLALLEEKYRSAEVLIDLGGDLLIGGGIFGSALHLAVSKLKLDLVEKLLKGIYNKEGSNKRRVFYDFDKNTPFHILFSIFSKDHKSAELIAEKLLEYGLDPNIRNKELYTALHIAIKKNQLKALLFASEYNKKSQIFKMNKKGGNSKWSIAHLAAFLGNIEALHLLEESNINIFQENINFQTPIRVSFQSIVVIKTIRKAQKMWIKRNILQKQRKNTDYIENINDSVNIITKNMLKKQQVFKNSAKAVVFTHLLKLDTPKGLFPQFLESRKLSQDEDNFNEESSFPLNLQDNLLYKDYADDSPEFKIVSSRLDKYNNNKTSKTNSNENMFKTFSNKKKTFSNRYNDHETTPEHKRTKSQHFPQFGNLSQNIVKSQDYPYDGKINKKINKLTSENTEHEDLEEFHLEENVTQKMLNKSSQVISSFTERDLSSIKKKKKGLEDDSNQLISRIFTFKRKDMMDIHVFEEESNFEKEIERIYKILQITDIALSEKLLGILYLETIKYRMIMNFHKFSSIRLPINLFLLNETSILRKNQEDIAKNIEKLENEVMKEIFLNFREKTQLVNTSNKFKNHNEYIKMLRVNNENIYQNLNYMLFIIHLRNFGINEALKDEFEMIPKGFPKILLLEISENYIKNNKNRKKIIKKRTQTQNKSTNNVSVIINNNFFFTSHEKEKKEEIKKKKHMVSFIGISPNILPEDKNIGGFSSKPYFFV